MAIYSTFASILSQQHFTKKLSKLVDVCQSNSQCFDTVGWASGKVSSLSDEVFVWSSV